MLLGGRTREGLEPVREVGRSLLERPLLHRLGDTVGNRRIELGAILDRRKERLVLGLGETRLHLVKTEEVLTEHLFEIDPLLDLGRRHVLRGGEGVEAGHDSGHVWFSVTGRVENDSPSCNSAPPASRPNLHI